MSFSFAFFDCSNDFSTEETDSREDLTPEKPSLKEMIVKHTSKSHKRIKNSVLSFKEISLAV
jgi:hypothetical protein